MKTLVIYEVIPEETKMAIVDLSEEEFTFLNKAHGYTENVSDFNEKSSKAVMAIEAGFSVDGKYVQDEVKDWTSKFVDGIVTRSNGSVTDISGVERLISTAFYL